MSGSDLGHYRTAAPSGAAAARRALARPQDQPRGSGCRFEAELDRDAEVGVGGQHDAGLRARRRTWLVWAAAYGALAVIAGIADGSSYPNSTASGIGAVLMLGAWIGGTVHAAVARREAGRQIRPPRITGLGEARQRIERRAEGRRLAARDPRLAKELGVGRPDIPGAEDFGLIDVNRASLDALCRLPGVTQELARRITEIRQDVGFFKSDDELGIYLDLSPVVADEMREYSVFF